MMDPKMRDLFQRYESPEGELVVEKVSIAPDSVGWSAVSAEVAPAPAALSG